MSEPNTIKTVTMTETQLRELIRGTVSETLTSLGIAHNKPHEMQKDFMHLREMRLSSEAMKGKFQVTMIGIAITTFLSLAAIGLKSYFNS